MLPNRNEEYLLKFISKANKDNNFIEIVANLGAKHKSHEYNQVYQIIDELNYYNISGKEVLK